MNRPELAWFLAASQSCEADLAKFAYAANVSRLRALGSNNLLVWRLLFLSIDTGKTRRRFKAANRMEGRYKPCRQLKIASLPAN
jgi:hypothetical protein